MLCQSQVGNLTPFRKGGRSVEFDVPAGVMMSFLVEMVVE
jgi:hypothetical protein